MQVVRYYQYLKDECVGMGPRKGELLLWAAQRFAKQTKDPKDLNVAMAKLSVVDLFCTREPHLVSEEVFGSQKRKADIPIGFEGESHRPNKVNFSHLWISTKSAKANHAKYNLANVVEELSPNLQENQALNNLGTTADIGRPPHVIAIEETTCMKMEWHIARLPKTSSNCFAQQAVTKKKCTSKIVQDNRSTAAPTYTVVMVN
jgi:hypothetical protein